MDTQEKLIADLTTERDDARKSLASANESNALLIKAHDNFKLEINGLETQRAGLRNDIASLRAENDALRAEITGKDSEISALKTENAALKSDQETAEFRAAKIVAQVGIVHGPATVTSGSPVKTLTQRAIEAKAALQNSQ